MAPGPGRASIAPSSDAVRRPFSRRFSRHFNSFNLCVGTEGGATLIATTIPPGASRSSYAYRSVTGRDLISIQDFSPDELACALELASALKMRPADFRGILSGKQIVLFFEKPSLRTRLTFEAGINSLGGSSFFVDQTQSRLGARESLSDVAHNLERWIDGIVLRTFAHETVTTMAQHACIPVINALSDVEHPCQAMADMLTLQQHFGDLRGVRLAYVGDGNNVAHSLMLAAASLGASISVGTSERLRAEPRHHRSRKRARCRFWCDGGGGQRSARSCCRRRRDLHRRLGQHGTGRRSFRSQQDLRSVPGQPEVVRVRRKTCSLYALPAGASRR